MPAVGANGGLSTMGHGSNYITAFRKEHQLDVRFSGTVEVPLPAVSRECPMSYRHGVFVLPATQSTLQAGDPGGSTNLELTKQTLAEFHRIGMNGRSLHPVDPIRIRPRGRSPTWSPCLDHA